MPPTNGSKGETLRVTLLRMSDPPVGPPDGRLIPCDAGPDTFARLPALGDVGRAQVAIIGVPFDSGVSYRPGARFGPGAVRAGSKMLRPYHPALDVEPWAVMQVADAGDLAVNPFSIAEAITTITNSTRQLLTRCDHVIAIGGDHTIALPLLRATTERYGPWPSSTSTPTSTPGTATSASRIPMARRLSRRGGGSPRAQPLGSRRHPQPLVLSVGPA